MLTPWMLYRTSFCQDQIVNSFCNNPMSAFVIERTAMGDASPSAFWGAMSSCQTPACFVAECKVTHMLCFSGSALAAGKGTFLRRTGWVFTTLKKTSSRCPASLVAAPSRGTICSDAPAALDLFLYFAFIESYCFYNYYVLSQIMLYEFVRLYHLLIFYV